MGWGSGGSTCSECGGRGGRHLGGCSGDIGNQRVAKQKQAMNAAKERLHQGNMRKLEGKLVPAGYSVPPDMQVEDEWRGGTKFRVIRENPNWRKALGLD